MNTAVVFVHGFGDKPEVCWKTFKTLLDADPAFKSGFSFDYYGYDTEWFNFNPLQRIPTLDDLGSGFGDYMALNHAGDTNWILVGHSQGGLVIQNYLMQQVHDGHGRDLAKIRSVVLFATPNLGSDIFMGLRKVAFELDPNPQERTLRVLNDEISKMRRAIEIGIINATSITDNSCPIPFQAFWGESDPVVPAASARGDFIEAQGLPGNHGGIINPPNDNDQRYLALKAALLRPIGHPAFYEIDSIEVKLEVSPLHGEEQHYHAQYGTTARDVETDNRARRLLNIAFAKENRCVKQYQVQYRTNPAGFVRFLGIREPNEAAAEAESRYREAGTELMYCFTPKNGETFWMDVEVYKGFDAGNRTWHDHVPSTIRCRTYRFTLDLSKYLEDGFTISREPEFRWNPVDVRHDDEVADQRSHELVAAAVPGSPPGVWVWELDDYRGGLLDLAWDVAKT
jgi:pimeloyl-ACP methyl ester carboxylesterase